MNTQEQRARGDSTDTDAWQYANANPHIHSILTDGLFEENGVFYCMPEYTGKVERKCPMGIAKSFFSAKRRKGAD